MLQGTSIGREKWLRELKLSTNTEQGQAIKTIVAIYNSQLSTESEMVVSIINRREW